MEGFSKLVTVCAKKLEVKVHTDMSGVWAGPPSRFRMGETIHTCVGFGRNHEEISLACSYVLWVRQGQRCKGFMIFWGLWVHIKSHASTTLALFRGWLGAFKYYQKKSRKYITLVVSIYTTSHISPVRSSVWKLNFRTPKTWRSQRKAYGCGEITAQHLAFSRTSAHPTVNTAFLPEASIGLRVLSLPASVRPSVRHQVCPRNNSSPVQARITKFGP